jgi:sulfate transport system permease protein
MTSRKYRKKNFKNLRRKMGTAKVKTDKLNNPNKIQRKQISNNNSKTTRVIPGYHLTLGITVTMLSLIVLIPLASVLAYALKLSPIEIFRLLTKKNVMNSFITSISCSFIAALVNCVFGLIIAWVLVKYDFPGKRLMDGFIELPFALPTAVAGITLSKLYSETGLLGKPLASLGIKVNYTKLGIIIALVFVGIPFVVRNVQPVLEKMDNQYEEAAYILGATPSKTFFKVILPELTPSLLTGFGLAFARGIGEYGSVIYISGNSAKEHTQVISYVIMQKLGYIDYESAAAIALAMLIISFLLLLIINIIQVKQSQRVNIL